MILAIESEEEWKKFKKEWFISPDPNRWLTLEMMGFGTEKLSPLEVLVYSCESLEELKRELKKLLRKTRKNEPY